ncbi:MAG: DEAD/DEAH box helicase family protein [Candidatus Hydrogenedentes bacterium]|nr:DEAD/DEAH box helicase family protein [Candidatus Hydrogenedentota bacterium]
MNPNNEIERLRKELEQSQRESDRLQSENSKLKDMLEAFSVKPAASLKNQPPQRHVESQPDITGAIPATNTSNSTADERIQLFRSLFRGREDVYAVRWESKKGKSGYSPACAHEWDPILCKKPNGKCTNCSYLPLTNEVVRAHLLGQKTIGIYPLLQDETCWFLATDFDKEGWQEDARVFLETCRAKGAKAYLERSRSGRGGHIWIFFQEAIPAALARKLGSAILTTAMDERHQVGLASYDRLFPNQDTMPKGGFGNLIALPLQRGPRKAGNSEFLGDAFQPHPEQWRFLESVQRLSRNEVQEIVNEVERRDTVLGVRLPATDESADQDPWTLPPSKRQPERQISGPFPQRIPVVQSNLLYIEKEGLNPALTNRIIRLAAFQNPEFYAAQAMRLSTFGKPRVIGCAEESPRHLALPRGCVTELQTFLHSLGIVMELEDKRHSGNDVEFTFQGQLRAEQEEAAIRLLKHDDGVLVAPPGFGKTMLAAWAIAKRRKNTLILVHRTTLLDQWREQLALFLDISRKSIGAVGAGRKKATGILDIAMLQSIQRKGEVADLVADYGHVIVDECHHVSAFTFERIMKEVKAKYVLGLTATPLRKDGHHPIIFMQCGPIRHIVHIKQAAANRPFEHFVIPRATGFCVEAVNPSIHDIYAKLVQDMPRNHQIVADVAAAISRGRVPLILTERIEHIATLESMLCDKIDEVIVLRGGTTKKNRVCLQNRSGEDGKSRYVILATGRYIGEGFDYAPLDTLFLAMPISWRGTLQQYVGRLHRLHASKNEVRVYDYVDHDVPMLARMFAKRLRGYRAMGYVIQDVNEQLPLPVSSLNIASRGE